MMFRLANVLRSMGYRLISLSARVTDKAMQRRYEALDSKTKAHVAEIAKGKKGVGL